MRYSGNKTCPEERTNAAVQAARKRNAFADIVGCRRHKKKNLTNFCYKSGKYQLIYYKEVKF